MIRLVHIGLAVALFSFLSVALPMPARAEVKKIKVCHVEYRTPGKGHLKEVPKVAWDVHRAHGDCKDYFKIRRDLCSCEPVIAKLSIDVSLAILLAAFFVALI